jgi:hypothetical protein
MQINFCQSVIQSFVLFLSTIYNDKKWSAITANGFRKEFPAVCTVLRNWGKYTGTVLESKEAQKRRFPPQSSPFSEGGKRQRGREAVIRIRRSHFFSVYAGRDSRWTSNCRFPRPRRWAILSRRMNCIACSP